MKKFLSLALSATLLSSIFTSCRRTEDDPSSGGETLRPLEEYTPDHLFVGEYADYPEALSFQADSSFLYNGKMIIQTSETRTEEDEYGRLYRPAFFILEENGNAETVVLPHGSALEQGMNATSALTSALGDDRMAVIERNFYLSDTNGEGRYGEWILTVFDSAGNVLWSDVAESLVEQRTNPVTGKSGDYSFSASALHFSPDGTLYMVAEYSVLAFSPDGEKLYETGSGVYIDQVYRAADGRLLIEYTDVAEGKRVYAWMDDEAQGFSAPVTLPDPGFAEYTLHLGAGFDWYFRTSDGLYGMNDGDGTPTLLCSWESSALDPAFIRQILILDADTFFLLYEEYPSYRNEYAVLHRVPEDEIQPRSVVTLGTTSQYISFTTYSNYIQRFNRRSREYRLVLRDYTELAQEKGTTATLLLESDIMNGNAPDIIFEGTFSNSMDAMADKGVLLDLNAFLGTDDAFRSDLFACVQKPFEKNGALYQLASSMSVYGMYGKSKNVPAVEDWTLENFFMLLESSRDDGRSLLDDSMTRKTMENFLLYYSLPSFMDYESGTCTFDGSLFLQVIEYLNTLPTQDQREAADVVEDMVTMLRDCREDRTLVDASFYLNSPGSYIYPKSVFGGEEITYLGVPTPSGGKPVVDAGDVYAITADSPVSEGAWQVIRYLIMNEKVNIRSGFPVSRTQFLREVEAEQAMYHVVGMEFLSSVSGYWKNVSGTVEYNAQTEMLVYLTEPEVKTLIAMLEREDLYVNSRAESDSIVRNIIEEELAVFYMGSCTAAEAAERIQSRISLYLAERS